jgi:hypothetical protein
LKRRRLRISARSVSVHITISWLSEFLVSDHLVLESDEDFFHGVGWVPVFEHREFVWFNNTVLLVNAWEVAFGVEFDLWSLSWIVLSAGDVHHVDSVIEVGVLWTNDSSVPVSETFIIT